MRHFRNVLLLACLVQPPPLAEARWAIPDLERVPIERLIESLQRQVQERPSDMQPRYALARVQSMAYALKIQQVEVDKRTGGPFFGYGGRAAFPPGRVEVSRGSRQEQQAREHLGRAIENYRKAVEIDPNHVFSELGLGWCLDQAGDRDGALAAYRRALELAWKREKDMRSIEAGASATEDARSLREALGRPGPVLEELPEALVGVESLVRWFQATAIAAVYLTVFKWLWKGQLGPLGVGATQSMQLVPAIFVLALPEKARQARSKGIAWREFLYFALRQPVCWPLWYPRASRRSGDLWDRLPALVRRSRALFTAATAVGLGLLIPSILVVFAPTFIDHMETARSVITPASILFFSLALAFLFCWVPYVVRAPGRGSPPSTARACSSRRPRARASGSAPTSPVCCCPRPRRARPSRGARPSTSRPSPALPRS